MDLNITPPYSKALDFARLSLAGKKRNSGEFVVDHCIRVTETLLRFKVNDPPTLVASILHHSLHEGAANIEDIRKEFGEEVGVMMEAFEKLRIIKPKEEMGDVFAENLRKMFLVLAKDLRVVLIKLADILDNLTTLQYVDEVKRREVCQKALEIFAPLAERLGMGEMRGQMQDLAFMYLQPAEYKWVQSYTKSNLEKLGKELLRIKGSITLALKKEGIPAEVQSRVKHIYSLYTKLTRPEIKKDLSKIHDLIALRIIVSDTEECYKVLDIVHKEFKPLPEPISDYIAHPRPNGYQSIHTRVYGSGDLPFEIQIRTRVMHEEAEYGVAAHWNYAEKKEKGLSDEKISQGFAASAEKLDWVKRLGQWQTEITDDSEFLKTVKTDLFGQRIFCFTPNGDVKDLPAGATPIDFAYTVHTEMGDSVSGAKLNGKVVSLDTKLKNGDVVELVLSKDMKKKPSRDWLHFVVTPTAKRKIKKAHALS
ncbi:hypothetical protein A3A14_03380 [Candidatus Daviesbacteria bacterium RIFCSPLOWO2_01_FULL_43_38]|uniref:TGS domain-containing protein n=3 Tax=Candidatus Daviesiibacteriota TaxID=1752718 RepID=A0A1F5K747_9BACT|nr:MAG: hypothetical protein A2874_02005 [Candidatus Daviesbacteria bacterium RIFCSPHIGHO2_01_FULL_43_17]OGE36767.1 MAG: hypothetical protein A3E45_01425 [Candidatus Daviesbacteria bacterium RIFCSPHIGHO2_12_FULL_43_11]OGE63685.1 MAG: hypothetical protein A3A14_03380 [Candidatus Daviesbacteria bacterium RIFCSPLOWO2_01_FULL_43_38]